MATATQNSKDCVYVINFLDKKSGRYYEITEEDFGKAQSLYNKLKVKTNASLFAEYQSAFIKTI
mgnify:CR=1 FL=1